MELKVARDERGVALAAAGSWEDTLVAAREQAAPEPKHGVSGVVQQLLNQAATARQSNYLHRQIYSTT